MESSGSSLADPRQTVTRPGYFQSLSEALRHPEELIRYLGLSESLIEAAQRATTSFPLLVPRSYADRMERGNPDDPLLRQVLPLDEELLDVPGFTNDAVGDGAARRGQGVIQKYDGRALLIITGACAVHCRYCFRRHFPYADESTPESAWEESLAIIRDDPTIEEVILSGGDPLMLPDGRLGRLMDRIGAIPHVRRLRIHTRLPIVLPDRVTDALRSMLVRDDLTVIVVLHANHPAELIGDCAEAILKLRNITGEGNSFPVTLLNQAVLLRGVNDAVEVQQALSARLVELGVVPYYLHQLDRVAGASHFEVSDAEGRELIDALWRSGSGYLVPRFVREIKGKPGKSAMV